MDLKSLTSCSQLTEDHFAHFTQNPKLTYELLDRFAEITAYDDGTENIILFLARLALPDSWLRGTIQIEISDAGTFRIKLDLRRLVNGKPELLKSVQLKTSCNVFLSFREPQFIRPYTCSMLAYGPKKSALFMATEDARKICPVPHAYAAAQLRLTRSKQTTHALPELPPTLRRERDKRHVNPIIFGQEPPTIPQGRNRTPVPPRDPQK